MRLNEKEQGLAALLGQRLVDKGWMFACAESCTGGLLAAAMTDTAGASQWFDLGFVTYSNRAKVEQLGVSEDTLERFGAVSEETAMEMASGVLEAATPAHLAVSVTGIAGPDGGTPGKPVGMVCFGFAQRTLGGVTTRAATKIFEGDRAAIRRAAVDFALRTALDLLPAPL
ncbi:nicotinamide-nucleotide amidohydrolase family protein [Pusillimonas sp. TS35]|jgi:nicotinamide-nucleotide amidase|uniref:CinA family protein n=1 Tax=Paracandidimonas lactea TaxID=2895524 RepID=UPI001368D46A|nr:nicotinamide-nucleotide amidohydrolase family protein [Paracandidimonas lactea]MYN12875.1 nicotinamide-nucleotide amidohydrolase family protein [Pusillimonas sp. TS35]